jgi:hypothetical protein
MQKNPIQPLAVITSSIMLSWGIFEIPPAQANIIFWDLEFFENTALVGTGEFSYDPTTETFVQTSTRLPDDPVEGFFVQNALESFSVNLLAENYDLNDQFGLVTWWQDQINPPGEQNFVPRSPAFRIEENTWSFLQGPVFSPNLTLNNFERRSDILWQGNWSASTQASEVSEKQWVATLRSPATAIPEPTFSFSILVVAALGIALKRPRL